MKLINHDHHQSGFTIIEILVVISMIAIISSFSFTSFLSTKKTSIIKNEATRILDQLKLAQSSTITSQNIQSVLFNLNQNSYQRINKTNPVQIVETYSLPADIIIHQVTGLNNNSEAVFTKIGGLEIEGQIILKQLSSGLTTTINLKPSGYVSFTSPQ